MAQETESKKKRSPAVWILVVAAMLVFLLIVCVIVAALSGSPEEGTATATSQESEPTDAAAIPTATVLEPEPTMVEATQTATPQATNTPPATSTPEPTVTPGSTDTPEPTNTPEPTDTPIPPTATPDGDIIQPGTYLVGIDIRPGIYKGQAGYDLFDSCYWARLKDLSDSLDSILANDNSIGQFYIEVREGDKALETHCRLAFLDPLPGPPAEFPQSVVPGMYLVGIDISSGTYRGQAGDDIMDSCYWARLKNVAGDLDSILANDNATGQYYIEVQPGDFALSTACDLERVGD